MSRYPSYTRATPIAPANFTFFRVDRYFGFGTYDKHKLVGYVSQRFGFISSFSGTIVAARWHLLVGMDTGCLPSTKVPTTTTTVAPPRTTTSGAGL